MLGVACTYSSIVLLVYLEVEGKKRRRGITSLCNIKEVNRMPDEARHLFNGLICLCNGKDLILMWFTKGRH